MADWSFKTQTVKVVGAVTALDFCAARPHDFCASAGTRLHVFDGTSSAVKRQFARFKDKAYSGSFRRDGRLIVAGGEDAVVQVFDSGSRALLRQFKGHKAPVHVAHFAADQLRVLSGGDDGVVAMWDVTSGQQVSSMLGHSDYVRSVVSSPVSADVWATSGYDHVCKLWDARQRRCLLTVDHGAPIESVAFFPSGGHCVACTASRHPNAGGAQLSQESAIPCRAGSLLVTAGGTDLCFWQLLQSGQLVQRVTAHQKTITSVVVAALASSQPHVVSAGLDGHVKVTDWETFRPSSVHKYPVPVLSLAAAPAADTLAVGMADGALSIHRRKQGSTNAPAPTRLRWRPARLVGGKSHFSGPAQASCQDVDTAASGTAKGRLPRHLALLSKFRHAEALQEALESRRFEALESVLHALVEEDVLETLLAAAPTELLTALLHQTQNMLTDPKYADSVVTVLHLLLTAQPGHRQSTKAESATDWLQQLQSRLAEELRTQEQLLSLLGLLQSLTCVSAPSLVYTK